MAASTSSAGPALNHVFFFLARHNVQDKDTSFTAVSPRDTNTTALLRETSPASGNGGVHCAPTGPLSIPTGAAPDIPVAEANATSLKADAPAFVPRAIAYRLCEVRPSKGKGMGVFACQPIARGTRILSEKVLLEVEQHSADLAYHEYLRLSASKKTAYDSLHGYVPEYLDAEHTARVCAIKQNVGEEDLPQYVAEHARVMGIFSCNDFHLANGHLGVFRTASRFNHSCVPNVFHSNNPVLHQETLHAARDILPGEELLVNYLGSSGVYQLKNQRLQRLQNHYGFQCRCVACSDTTGRSDSRRQLLSGIFWGLNEFSSGTASDGPFIPSSPSMALVQAEDGIRFLTEERLLNNEVIKAYRTASTLALDVGDYERALKHALNEQEVELILFGQEVDDLVAINMAAKQWTENVYFTSVGTGHKFKASFLRKLSTSSQQSIKEMETKRLQTKGPVKRLNRQPFQEKSSSAHPGKKKQSVSTTKQQAQVDNIAPTPAVAE